MDIKRIQRISSGKLKTPCFLVDESAVEDNLKILSAVQEQADIKILLALKAFSMFSVFPLIRRYLNGVCASGLYEAKLGFEKFGKEVHTFSPAFADTEFSEIIRFSDYVIFNSFSQWNRYKPLVFKSGKKPFSGLRVNPEHSAAGKKFGVYDPCSENSRLGITLSNFSEYDMQGITGLHIHALCEQNADAFEEVLEVFIHKFGHIIRQMIWINFGGGHHITAKNYNRKKLAGLLRDFRKRLPSIKRIYLEPGEAVVLNAGVFISTVLDIVRNKKNIAITDSSVETHFPDILITRAEPEPYVPEISGAEKGGNSGHSYLLGGISCAAGDVFGEYSFKRDLKPGDRIIFMDAAHYSMVKTSTFNGVKLPDIYILKKNGELRLIKRFSYDDFIKRL